MGLFKEKDTRIAFIVMATILASIFISASVFHKDPSPALLVVGFFFLVCIPWYVVYRIRQNRNENASKHEVKEVLRETIESLNELEQMVVVCAKRFEKVKDYEQWKKETRRISRKIENFDEELSAIEYLDSCQEEIESISNGLKDLHDLMENYGFFYENIQRRNKIAKLKAEGKAITKSSLEE